MAGLSRWLIPLVTACSHGAQPATKEPPRAVGIVLPSAAQLPRLDVRATFPAIVDPGPHVSPLATALVAARARCFGGGSPPGLAAALHAELHDGRIRASATNEAGRCLAAALDGAATTDRSQISVDLLVSAGGR